jgi:hypothetical protein
LNGLSKSMENGSYKKLEVEGGIKGRAPNSISCPCYFLYHLL